MPSFEDTKSPAFSNLLKYNGFGRLYEGLVKIGLPEEVEADSLGGSSLVSSLRNVVRG
jgi:hypothetical protein